LCRISDNSCGICP
jgi:hypothetical protein